MAEQDIPPPTITAMKIPIIRKGEYDIWSMRMRQYICHTDHNLWDVIVNGDLEEEPAPTGETSAPPAPKTAKQLAARRNQERVKSILLLAIPDEYLLKFHNVADAKSLWEAIKSRFGGNVESKKMQKNVLKHQFENFSTASNESLDKAYDRFQKLISQLEVHGAPISKEDINQKFLRSLPSSWNQIALIMRNKPDIDEIDIDDLYNNLRVYEDELKRSSGSNSASQNLAFLSSENTSNQNFVAIGSAEDERQIKEMNEESKDPEKKRLKKRVINEEDTAKVHAKQEATKQGTKKRKSGHVKMIARKRPRPQPDDDSDDEHRKYLRIVTFEGTIDSENMETKSFIARLHKVSSPDGNYLAVYKVNGHFRAFNYLMEKKTIKVISGTINKNRRLYEACRVCILELKDGAVIYMLVERRYHLSKELLQQMIDLGLEVKEESTAALQLVRFIKQQLNEE
ncbi:hypothetical protein Tco_1031866 [Tanacetum coccineum]|uniref:Uncharacterized protein n=1 Tax=Tanacetum coccineum TaxID=301880 RepID=A0ABQ5GAQ7_9ASTR